MACGSKLALLRFQSSPLDEFWNTQKFYVQEICRLCTFLHENKKGKRDFFLFRGNFVFIVLIRSPPPPEPKLIWHPPFYTYIEGALFYISTFVTERHSDLICRLWLSVVLVRSSRRGERSMWLHMSRPLPKSCYSHTHCRRIAVRLWCVCVCEGVRVCVCVKFLTTSGVGATC